MLHIGLIILAGGKSSRMGADKVWLSWQGKTFFSHLLEKTTNYGFSEILVSANEQLACYAQYSVTVVADRYTNCGPLGGLHAALQVGTADYFFVVSCDMPLFQFSVAAACQKALGKETQVVVPVTAGRKQPLAALYHKSCLPVIEKLLQEKTYKIQALLEQVNTKWLNMDDYNSLFFNVNTPQELLIARAKAENSKRRTPIVTIAAAKSGTGKTTFITKLLPVLKTMGIRTAVVKSDGHGFSLDQEGKDTWQFVQAGAEAVAIAGPEQYAIMVKTTVKKNLLELAEKIDDVDLILIESRQSGVFPILEISRKGYTEKLITSAENLAGMITDDEVIEEGVTRLPLDNPLPTAQFIKELMG